MAESAVFVTGATGTVGSAVVHHLAARGESIVAGVRADGRVAPPGAAIESRPFDFGDPVDRLTHAMSGCDRLFLMRPPAIEDVKTFLFPVIDAARRLGMRQIVFLSLQGVQGNRRTPHYAVEQYLRHTDAPFTFLRPNFFMQNLSTTYADDIRERGEIAIPAGRALTALVDARDVGRVAATVLTEPGHERTAYTLSGEHSFGYRRVAREMSEVLGRPIVYTRPSEADYLARLATDGRPADYIDVQKMIYRVVRANISALPNRTIRRITGEPATSLRRFISDHREVWAPGGGTIRP